MKDRNGQTRATDALRRAIREVCCGSEEGAYLHRLHLVLLLLEGLAAGRLGGWFGVSERTLKRWDRAYDESGLDGLKAAGRKGRPCKLASDQVAALRQEVSASPASFGYEASEWTGSLVCERVRLRFGLSLSLRQCQRLLANLLEGSRPVRLVGATARRGGRAKINPG